MIKRAATAIRDAHSNDVLKLAIVALRAAIRDEADIAELLTEPPPRRPAVPPAEAQVAAA
jgi:hypothetical protein